MEEVGKSKAVRPYKIGVSSDKSELLCLRSFDETIIGPGGSTILMWAIPGLVIKASSVFCLAPELRIEHGSDFIEVIPVRHNGFSGKTDSSLRAIMKLYLKLPEHSRYPGFLTDAPILLD